MQLNTNKVQIEIATQCMTLKEIAEKSGMNTVTLTRILSGKHSARPDTIGRLARALGKTVEEIIILN